MTMRNFRQHAQGFGNTDSQVIVSLDGNIIYQGAVLTVPGPRPSLPNLNYDIENLAWTWQLPMDFQGTRQISIAVSGSPILLGRTLADGNWPEYSAFRAFCFEDADPFKDVVIDGVSRARASWELDGQYWWFIPEGSIWTASMHVNRPDQFENAYVVFNSAPSTVPAGTQAHFLVSIPEVDPDHPLPKTYIWQIVNVTSTDSDFDNISGNVIFDSADSSFAVDIANDNDLEHSRNFMVQILTSNGIPLGTSQTISIIP